MDGIRAFKMGQLSELRLVCQEVGSLSDARSMPTEIRKWWCGKIIDKDNPNPPPGGSTVVERDGKRFVTKDVK